MPAVALPAKERVIGIIEDWEKSFQPSDSGNLNKSNKREFVELLCKVWHIVDGEKRKLENDLFFFSKKDLERILTTASGNLETTLEVLEEVEEALHHTTLQNHSDREELELYQKTLRRLEKALENLILIGTKAEIKYFDEEQKAAYAKILPEQREEARKVLERLGY